ncbi:MAG TPA: hypothetical protein VFQ44_12020 [Streptosporangiaceae bacterium]|nr:hypothetical protein [Streptosporangiaceae bacterium]
MSKSSAVSGTEPKVAIIDDHEMIREGFRGLSAHGIHIGALAETVDDLLSQEADPASRSSVAVLDVSLSDRSWVGDNVLRLRDSGYRVVILTSTALPDALREALTAGACALVAKNDQIGPLVAAIKAVAGGAPLYLTYLMAQVIQPSRLALREMERDILRYVAGGLTTEQIASLMSITDDLVESSLRVIANAYREAYPEPPALARNPKASAP